MPEHRKPAVSYSAPRLRFVLDKIDRLAPTDIFEIVTPDATFRMSRADFERDFANVVRSPSYQNAGYYHYSTVPSKATKYIV
jgi:hypothetical protein